MTGMSKPTRREFIKETAAAAVASNVPLLSLAKVASGYSLDEYEADVRKNGLQITWQKICDRVIADGEDSEGILQVPKFGELYEIGLAQVDKNAKKESGQYYTPPDVSRVMAEWFDRCKGSVICDVGCGVGNLILAYFEYIGRERTLEILRQGRLHLYDLDPVALFICVKSIAIRYGADIERFIHVHQGDFIDANVRLPEDCKVITNPPYGSIDEVPDCWPATDVINDSKELYSSFMEKILEQSVASVIITPYSFIGGKKFYSLRRKMNSHNGFVVSFDNVPGAIFCGRKHGIFNTNTSNSVRATITVVENDGLGNGFRFSPLIRFKAVERTRLLKCDVLESFVGAIRQTVDRGHPMFAKCDRRLDNIFDAWNRAGEHTPLALYLSDIGAYEMFIPNSCRYFTSASVKSLSRKGQINLRFADADVFNYIFCLVNSSFSYWHWRLYDGGITYPKGLLLGMPVFYERLSSDDKEFFKTVATEMIRDADSFIVTKNNIGIQENIKYPRRYRDEINERLLKILNIGMDAKIFDIVHSNMALEVNVGNHS